MAGVVLVVTWHEDGGLFGDSGPAWAACYFGHPASSINTEGTTLELMRLVRDEEPGRPPLTGLIAAGLHILKQHKMADLVISYADTGQNHHGGIYRAASWDYIGLRQIAPRLAINGIPMHTRQVSQLYGTRSLTALTDRGVNVARIPRTAKHLYAKALTKTGRRDLEAIRSRLGPS
jgi:hypothetical protein